jgi:flagellin FlaB
MRKIINREDAFTGLEAAIVLIAFVVVAAVFSYVVLGAGFFTTQKSQEVVYTGVEQASSSFTILGDVYGLNISADTPETIEIIQFTVGLTAGGTPIDFQSVTMTWQSSEGIVTLTKDSGVAASVTVTNTTGLAAGSWGIMEQNNADGTDSLLENDEQFVILVKCPTANELEANEEFNLEIRPSVGAALGIKKEGPAKIAAVNILY